MGGAVGTAVGSCVGGSVGWATAVAITVGRLAGSVWGETAVGAQAANVKNKPTHKNNFDFIIPSIVS